MIGWVYVGVINRKSGKPFPDFLQVEDLNNLPPGVVIYPSRGAAKQAHDQSSKRPANRHIPGICYS